MDQLKKTLHTCIDMIFDMISFLVSPEDLRQLDEYATYERGCLSLAVLIHHPFERVRDAVDLVACEVSHPRRDLPNHIEMLMKNGWLASENNPDHIMAVLGPSECEQGCLAKFYSALRWKAEEDED